MAVRRMVIAWCGLALVAASGLLAGCGGDNTPVTAEKSKFRPADAAKADKDVGLPPVDLPQGLPAANPGTETPTESVNVTEPGTPAVAKNGTNPPAATPADPGAPAANPAGSGDKEVVVSQEVKQMLTMIQELQQPPPGKTEQEQVQNLLKAQYLIVELSSRILATNSPPRVQEFALQNASQAMQLLQQIGDPSAVTRMTTFASAVAKNPNADIARKGRLMLFDASMANKLGAEKIDAPAILKEVEQVLEKDSGDVEVLQLTSQVCQMLGDRGHRDEAVKGMRAIATAYKDHKDEQLAAAGMMHEHSANLLELGPKALLLDVLAKKPDADAKLLAAFQELLKGKAPSPAYIQPTVDVIVQLERNGFEPLTKEFLNLIETAYSTSENPDISKLIKGYVETSRKRFDLVGQPFAVSAVSLEGKDMPGKALDVKSLLGKVLLVSCWRTDSEGSRSELPVLRRVTEKLQPQGLELVSLVLDTEIDKLQSLLTLNKSFIPWTVYVSPDVAKGEEFEDWHESSLAKELSLFGLPLYILVDKEGKVDSLHYKLDSEKLGLRLKELMDLPEVPKFSLDPPPPLTIDNPTIPKAAPIPNDAPPPTIPPVEPPKTEGKQSRALPDLRQLDRQLAAIVSPASWFSVLAAEDEPAKAEPAAEVNPYLAKPDLTSSQLTDWVQRMLDKPKTIQGRPGFSTAIAEACDRVLADKGAKETEHLVAIENKLAVLHRAACNGDEKADAQLAAFVAQLKDDARPRVARETAFFQQERKVLDASAAKPEELAALLKELQEYYAQEKLASKHLRMASATVDLINKLEDGDAREKHFAEFGQVFAKSSDKELARYGKKLAKKPETKESDLVGQPLELVGNTAAGVPFAWEKYRGKVVIVDFWATWCGPCRKEMPNVKALRERLKDKDFDVVGVSVDKDLEALDTYLEENEIPWETVAGDEASDLAEKYGVRGIPTMMLVDQKGIIVAVAHNVAALVPQAEKLLAK